MTVMAKTKKTAAPAENAQEARDELERGMDTPAAQEAAEGAANGQIIGPADAGELAGCQDEAELSEGVLTEYSVTAKDGLRLRERPSLDAPVIAVLPWGAGVFADEPPVGEWVCVTTGLLSGYMLVEHLAPLTAELKMAIVYD